MVPDRAAVVVAMTLVVVQKCASRNQGRGQEVFVLMLSWV